MNQFDLQHVNFAVIRWSAEEIKDDKLLAL